jgi:hypothetical protein
LSQSVGELKAQLVEQSAIPADQMRLIYRGHVLKDANSLQSYGKVNILANLDFGLQFCSFF